MSADSHVHLLVIEFSFFPLSNLLLYNYMYSVRQRD